MIRASYRATDGSRVSTPATVPIAIAPPDSIPVEVNRALMILRSRQGGRLIFRGQLPAPQIGCDDVEVIVNGESLFSEPSRTLRRGRHCIASGRHGIIYWTVRSGSLSGSIKLPRSFTPTADNATIDVIIGDEVFSSELNARIRRMPRFGWLLR